MTEARANLVEVKDIVAMLAQQADRLARELLPHGARSGPEWRVGSLAGEKGQSLAVRMFGERAGIWHDFESGEGGDALGLVAAVLFNNDIGRALEWSRRWLGLHAASPDELRQHRRQAAEWKEKADKDNTEKAEARRRVAHAMWLEAAPIGGTPVEDYLANRGIRLAELGHVPNALKFHPRVWSEMHKARVPAMLAAIQDSEGEFLATHRTYIEWREGAWRNVKDERGRSLKRTLGDYQGGWVRLTRGARGTPWSQLTAAETVCFAEGIENALSIALAVPEWRAASAVSLGNLTAIALPPTIRDVVIAADNDGPESRAVVALQKALRHLVQTGVNVRVARPDPAFKDWNDQVRAEEAEFLASTGP